MSEDKYVKQKVEQMGRAIYHYCSLNALDGILKNKELWLGNTIQMNDTEEELYLINDLNKKLKEDLSEDLYCKCDAFFYRVINELNREYPYAMCFSTLADDASMWERYADDATGIRIAFDTRKMILLFCNGTTDLKSVYYDFDMRQHELYNTVQHYIREDKLSCFLNERDLIDNILACATSHKNQGFKSENECRITTFWGHFLAGEPEFVMNNGVVKRVIKVNLYALCEKNNVNFEDLFSDILIDPRSKQNITVLKEYIKYFGYSNLAEKVYKSKCTLR